MRTQVAYDAALTRPSRSVDVTLEHGPEFDQVLTGASVTIRTKDGRVLQKRVDFPRGNPENRMSDAELRAQIR